MFRISAVFSVLSIFASKGAAQLTVAPGSSTPLMVCAVDSAGNVVPGAGKQITVTSVAADMFSGGHNHDDGNRPGGSFAPNSGTTQANGCYPSTFSAPMVSGTHTINLLLNGVTSAPKIKVGRFDLVHFGTSGDFFLKAPNPEHLDPYYCTGNCIVSTQLMANIYITRTGNALEINDAALVTGGRLDLGPRYTATVNGQVIQGKWWDIPHQAHMGLNVDVRFGQFYNAGAPVGHRWDNRAIFYGIAAHYGGNPYPESTHYHLRYSY